MGALVGYAFARDFPSRATHLAFLDQGLPGYGLLEYVLDSSAPGSGLFHFASTYTLPCPSS